MRCTLHRTGTLTWGCNHLINFGRPAMYSTFFLNLSDMERQCYSSIQYRRTLFCWSDILFWYSYICASQIYFQITTNKMQRFLSYLFLQTLYKFQAVPPPIIRRIKLYIQLLVLSNNIAACCYRGCDGTHGMTAASSSVGSQYLNTACTVMCSWWWAEEPPETRRASVEINKLTLWRRIFLFLF